ncbi:MAG: ACT domain-containing protein [Oscillospiraceae bacterium]|nr:ACT domain-containing protein [Oscillospiraceae bacterium]
MAVAKPKYYLVEASALPEVFVKVTEAKSLLETGEARTVAEAVERVGLSRSAFYKYKDCIAPFRDMKRDTIMTFHIKLHDKPGTLASVLSIFTESGANILTINQSIPVNGVAVVTISITTETFIISTEELMSRLYAVAGVADVGLMAG